MDTNPTFLMRAAGAALAIVLGVEAAVAGGSPTFTNETGARLQAAASVGSGDTTEKDYGLGDFDQDGDIDVFVARRLRFNPPTGLGNAAAAPNVLLMNENGVLTDRTATHAPDAQDSHASRDVLVMDVNGDGWLDVTVVSGSSAPVQVLLNQGVDGANQWLGFLEPAMNPTPVGNIDGWTIAGGDVVGDGDAFPDVYIGVKNGTHRLLRNLGEMNGMWQGFADESAARLGTNADTAGAIKSSQFHDLNGDGDLDLVYDETNPTGSTRILHNNGSGVLSAAPQIVFTGAGYNFGLGHLDNDQFIDFYGVRNGLDQLRRNLGPSGSQIAMDTTLTAPNTSNGFGAIVRPADLDGDGRTDFLVCDLDQEFPADCTRRLRIFFNTGVSPFLFDGYPTPQAWNHNGTSDVALIDLDGDGDLDMMIGHCTGQTIWMQDGSPTITGDLNGDGFVNGADLAVLLTQWGTDGSADLNDSGMVDGADLAILLTNWT